MCGVLSQYEAEIRAELMANDRHFGGHGWFTCSADNHSKHEVCAQDKTIMQSALAGQWAPRASDWDRMDCDIMHQDLPANCAANVEPGLPSGESDAQLISR